MPSYTVSNGIGRYRTGGGGGNRRRKKAIDIIILNIHKYKYAPISAPNKIL